MSVIAETSDVRVYIFHKKDTRLISGRLKKTLFEGLRIFGDFDQDFSEEVGHEDQNWEDFKEKLFEELVDQKYIERTKGNDFKSL